MTMTVLEYKTVKDSALLIKLILQIIKPKIDQLNIDYDAAGGVKSTLTDIDLAEEAGFSNITKVQVDDALYALTNVLKTAIDGSFSQMEILASRADPLPPFPNF